MAAPFRYPTPQAEAKKAALRSVNNYARRDSNYSGSC